MTSDEARSASVSLPIPQAMLDLAARLGQDQQTDLSNILLQWLSRGAEEVVVGLLERGDISKGYAVKVLETSYHDINHLLEARGIRLGPSDEQIEESKETAKGLKHHMRRR